MSNLSCKKFLDEQPVSSASLSAVFANQNTALQAVLGVYNQLAGTATYGSGLSLQLPFDTDEMIGFQNGAITDNQRKINSYALDAGNTLLSSPFTQLYAGIERANICIENIPAMPLYENGSATVKAELRRLHGEALTLRAQFYFDLVKLWGDMPAQWVPSATVKVLDLPKTDRDVIYDRIIEDLRIASELVPWRGEAGVTADERITKGAVKGLRARIALFRGGYSLRKSRQMERSADYLAFYTIARQECADIMARTEHKLNPSYQAIWKDFFLANKLETSEVLFEIAMAGETADSDSQIGAFNGIRATIAGVTYGNNRNYTLPTHFYAYSPFDKRRDVNNAPFYLLNTNLAGTGLIAIADGKWRRNWITPEIVTGKAYYGINWPMIRFSDILLMFAEAENELSGPSAAAIEAVNQVRRRSWTTGAVKTITLTNGGSGYTTIPTITFSGTTATPATAVAVIVGGAITAINIIDNGAAYTSAPTVTITGGGGTGASATTAITTAAEANLTATQTASKTDFLKSIQDERLFEFCSEGIRKYDLIRWNLLASKIAETKAELVKMLNKAAPYNTLPLNMYFKTSSPTLIWGNSFYAPSPATAPSGFSAVGWMSSITATALVDKFAADFVPNKGEILPIPRNILEASHGKIVQDYGY